MAGALPFEQFFIMWLETGLVACAVAPCDLEINSMRT
jgi:hypothetical protein